MLRLFLVAYTLIFVAFLVAAVTLNPSALVPIIGFFVLIYPAFLMCCALFVLVWRALPLASLLQLPGKMAFFPGRRG